MIDRNGKTVNVAWSPHEILWLEAAIQNGCEPEDLRDIADMSGRSYEAVKTMAWRRRAAKMQRRDYSKPTSSKRTYAKRLVPTQCMAGHALVARRSAGRVA